VALSARLGGRAAMRMPALIRFAFNLFLVGCFGVASALACTTTWTDGNSNWNNAANWDNGVPTSSSDACINNGSTVALDVTGNTGTLTLGGANTLNMGANQLNVFGASISNSGTLSTSDGILNVANNVVLSGAGTFSMSNGAWVQQNSGGLTLTNQDNLIQGDGQLGRNGLALNNQASGTVNANNSGATLFMNGGGPVSNAGLLTATNNGTLQISNNVTNTGNITGNGGSVLISSTVTGGTLNSTNSGTIGTSGTATLNGVTISAGSNYNAAGTTNLVGTITNNGTITSPNAFLQVSGGDVTLNGGGNVVLQNGAYLDQASGGLTLHNVNNTIQGAGQVGQNGLALDNQAAGTVNANVNGNILYLNGGGAVNNAGLLTATNSGILQISNNVTNTGANITANGGSVLISSTINGGTVSAINSGSIGTNSTATLNGVTISSGTNYNTGGVTNLIGTITNNGTLTSPNGFVQVTGGDVTLQGGGTVVLQTDAFIQQASGGLTLHNVDNTIQGAGQIGVNGLSLDNQASGIINATGALTLTGGGTVTNAGLLEATTGGTLQINNTVNNSSNITANGGTVLISSTINGGTLGAINGGSIATNSTATLNGVTISSGTNYNTGGVTNLVGTITNNGTLTSPNGFIQVTGGDVILQGGGTITLQTDAFIQQASGGLTLHNVDNTIQGAGQIGVNGLALDNQAGGVINANSNVAGQSIILSGGGTVTNAGLLEATNGGTLQINNTVNNLANITGNGGSVLISSTINGGTLSAINGGSIGTNGTATLNGVTISSGTNYNAGTVTNLVGVINNQGTITQNNEFLQAVGGDVTLTGGGTITLQGNPDFLQASGGLTLHNVNNTIQGSGSIGVNGLAIDNQAAGVIRANAGLLLINGGGLVTNAGTFEADAGSTLHVSSPLNGSTYSAGTLETGTYHVISTPGSPGTIQIDALGSTGGEIVKSSANIILDGPNANPIVDQANLNALSHFQDNLAGGNVTVQNGQNFTTTPTGGQDFQNEGNVTVADANSSFTTGGTANYNQDGANAATMVNGTLTAGGGQVNITGGLLTGDGTIVGNVLIGANGTLRPGDPPGPINITGNLQLNGTLDEQLGGTPGSGIFGQTDITGTASIGAGSTLDVSLVNGFVPAGTEAFLIMDATGGAITGQFTNVDFLNNTLGDSVSIDYSRAAQGEIFLDVTAPSTSATPEPGEFLPLVGLVGALAVWKIRRKRPAAA